ncbi:phagosome assembly factor 1 [Ciona intestinalis]|nr:UPF0183 protein C16orf70 homolog [Ciona intestinalis]|eukprot:XP_002125726.1 UPF0183 protein C16orf70 homolog [Ciona intestinalis]
MLDLQVVPERALGNEQWEFTLGMPIYQAVQIIQRQCRIIKEVHVVYNEKRPFDSDIILNLINDGIRLLFDSENQRLKVIEVYDMNKMKLKYCGAYFSSPQVHPTVQQIDQSFGATHPAQYDEKHHMFVLSFRGITFLFPVEHEAFNGHSLRSLPNTSTPVVAKMSIYTGNNLSETRAPSMPPSCYHGNLYSKCTEILLDNGKCSGLQMQLVSGGAGHAMELNCSTLIRRVRFGDTVQDVLTEIGSPCQTFYKLEDKMRIHSASPHKLSPTQHSDYFYNYFTLGLDILFDGNSHRVKKFVLHSNHPGHYNFNIYYRCEFKIDLFSENDSFAIVPSTRWQSVMNALEDHFVIGEPVVLNRASSTNTTNPFGSTFCYGVQNLIFEIMGNDYIASVTIYQPKSET